MRGVKALRFWGRLMVICKGIQRLLTGGQSAAKTSLHTILEFVPVKVADHQLDTVNTFDRRRAVSFGRPAAQMPQLPCLWAAYSCWHPRSTCPPFAASQCRQQLGLLPRLALAIPSALWYSMSSSFSP